MFTPITLMGRVTKDFELKVSKKNTPYVQFNLAITKGYGEQQHSNFYSCVLFDKPAERMINAGVKKGSNITIIGNLDCEEYITKTNTKGINLKVTVYDWDYVTDNKKPDTDCPAQLADDLPTEIEECGENGLPYD